MFRVPESRLSCCHLEQTARRSEIRDVLVPGNRSLGIRRAGRRVAGRRLISVGPRTDAEPPFDHLCGGILEQLRRCGNFVAGLPCRADAGMLPAGQQAFGASASCWPAKNTSVGGAIPKHFSCRIIVSWTGPSPVCCEKRPSDRRGFFAPRRSRSRFQFFLPGNLFAPPMCWPHVHARPGVNSIAPRQNSVASRSPPNGRGHIPTYIGFVGRS